MNPVLREARSSPYIGTPPAEANGHAALRLHSTASNDRFEQVQLKEAFESVQFKAGSSSSTDLQFICTDGQQANGTDSSLNQHEEGGGRHGQRPAERNASADNLAGQSADEQSSLATEVSGDSGQQQQCGGTNFLGKNRSETNLPGKAREGGFRLLEKCCSVELCPTKMIPPSRLARSKEMPNIADVDDAEAEFASYES